MHFRTVNAQSQALRGRRPPGPPIAGSAPAPCPMCVCACVCVCQYGRWYSVLHWATVKDRRRQQISTHTANIACQLAYQTHLPSTCVVSRVSCSVFAINIIIIINTQQPNRSTNTNRLRSTVVERRSFAVELSLSCARPAVDGWPLMWVNRPLQLNQLDQRSRFGVDKWVLKLLSDVCYLA